MGWYAGMLRDHYLFFSWSLDKELWRCTMMLLESECEQMMGGGGGSRVQAKPVYCYNVSKP